MRKLTEKFLQVFFLLFCLISVSFAASAQLYSANKPLDFNNPLVNAADSGNEQQVASLLASGSAVNELGDFGATALMRSALRGNILVARKLLDAGAGTDIQDEGGATALHFAARQGNMEIVNLLLERGANPNIMDNERWTPLMRSAAAKRGEVTKALLAKNADVTIKNKLGETAIFHAIYSGDSETAKILAGKGASVLEENVYGSNAIELAEKQNNLQLKTLLEEFAKNNREKSGEMKLAEKTKLPEKKIIKEIPVVRTEVAQEKASEVWLEANESLNSISASAVNKTNELMAKPAPKKNKKEEMIAAKLPEELPKSMQPKAEKPAEQPVAKTENLFDDEPKIKAQLQALEPGNPKIENKIPVAKVVTTPPVVTSANVQYYAQLGEFDEAYELDRRLQQINATNPDTLANRQIFSSQNADKIRLRIGGFSGREMAVSYCTQLRLKNISCFVVETDKAQNSYAFNADPNFTPESKFFTQANKAETRIVETPVAEAPLTEPSLAEAPAENQQQKWQKIEEPREIKIAKAQEPKANNFVANDKKKLPKSMQQKPAKEVEVAASVPIVAAQEIVQNPKDFRFDIIGKQQVEQERAAGQSAAEPALEASVVPSQTQPESEIAQAQVAPVEQPIPAQLDDSSEQPTAGELAANIVHYQPKTTLAEIDSVIVSGSSYEPTGEFSNQHIVTEPQLDRFLVARKLKLPVKISKPTIAEKVELAAKEMPQSLKFAEEQRKRKQHEVEMAAARKSSNIKVEVAEAIRVPASSSLPQAAPLISYDAKAIEQAMPAEKWLEISSFESAEAAENFYENIAGDINRALRLKIVRPLASEEIMLRVGVVAEGEAESICKTVRAAGRNCQMIDEAGTNKS